MNYSHNNNNNNNNNMAEPPSSSTTMRVDNRGHGYVGIGQQLISKSEYPFHYKSKPYHEFLTPPQRRRNHQQQDQRLQISTNDGLKDGSFNHSTDKMVVRDFHDNSQNFNSVLQSQQTPFTNVEMETPVSCNCSCTSDTSSSVLLGLEFLDDNEDFGKNENLNESREDQETKQIIHFEYGGDENVFRQQAVHVPAPLDTETKKRLWGPHSWLRSLSKIFVSSALNGKDNHGSEEKDSEYVQLKDLIQEHRHSLEHSRKKLLWIEKKRNVDRLNGYYGDECDGDPKSHRQECFEALGFFAYFLVDRFRPEQL